MATIWVMMQIAVVELLILGAEAILATGLADEQDVGGDRRKGERTAG